jgi:hypothetical protein
MIAALVEYLDYLVKLLVVPIIDLPTAVNAISYGLGLLVLAFLLRWLFLFLIPQSPDLDRDFRLIIVRQAAVLFTMALVLIMGWVAYKRGYLASLADLTGHLVYFIFLSLAFLVLWWTYRTHLRDLQELAEG